MASPSFAADVPPPLSIEAKIPLGAVKGRIDHMAMDAARQRLFVAELGNDSVGVVDLATRQLLRRITGLKEPQGVGYVAATDTLYVANAGDGTVRLFAGPDLAPAGQIDLGSDADNIRVDPAANHVLVGHGGGALAVIDAMARRKIADIALAAHPESFHLDAAGKRAFVNLPDAGAIAVVDLEAGSVAVMIPLRAARANFPMALDRARHRLLVVTRRPAKLLAFGLADNALQASLDTCGDADDVFVDDRRQRVYVSCGDGVIDVFASQDSGDARIARIPTVSGARTSFFDPRSDRLFVAVRAASGEVAAIWVFRPVP